jgi:hypothetical protein
MKFWLRLSATILSLMAEKQRTMEWTCNCSEDRMERCFMSSEKLISSGGPKAGDVLLVKSPQFGIFDWESTVLVAVSWAKERFDKNWWWQSPIDYSVI